MELVAPIQVRGVIQMATPMPASHCRMSSAAKRWSVRRQTMRHCRSKWRCAISVIFDFWTISAVESGEEWADMAGI